jgi:hypothetical protein
MNNGAVGIFYVSIVTDGDTLVTILRQVGVKLRVRLCLASTGLELMRTHLEYLEHVG